jgi:hypothetical protein
MAALFSENSRGPIARPSRRLFLKKPQNQPHERGEVTKACKMLLLDQYDGVIHRMSTM